jgi:hypothetical protein
LLSSYPHDDLPVCLFQFHEAVMDRRWCSMRSAATAPRPPRTALKRNPAKCERFAAELRDKINETRG